MNRNLGRLAVAVLLALAAYPSWGHAAPPESSCVVCHTSARMLIDQTRQLAQAAPPAAPLSEGEG